MEEEGVLFGVAGEYAGNRGNLRWGASASFAGGTLEYDGSVQDLVADDVIHAEAKTPNRVLGIQGRGGWAVTFGDLSVCPYLGLGYRRLVDDLPGDMGYTREQVYVYLPVGLETLPSVCQGWTAGLRVEGQLLIRGFNHSHADQGDFDMRVEQDSGYGVSASLRFLRNLRDADAEPLVALVEPFFQYWHIDVSSEDVDRRFGLIDGVPVDATIRYSEPGNTTSVVGVRLMVGF